MTMFDPLETPLIVIGGLLLAAWLRYRVRQNAARQIVSFWLCIILFAAAAFTRNGGRTDIFYGVLGAQVLTAVGFLILIVKQRRNVAS